VLETSHRVAIYAKINNVWRTQIEVHEIIADHYNIKIDKYGWKADPAKTHLLEFSGTATPFLGLDHSDLIIAIAWSPICHDFQNPMNNISVIALGSRGGQLTLLTAPDLRIQSITQVTQDWVTKIAFSDWVCSKNCTIDIPYQSGFTKSCTRQSHLDSYRCWKRRYFNMVAADVSLE